MEDFSDEQLIQALKIFKMKRKVTKSLWMEKTVNSQKNNHHLISNQATSAFFSTQSQIIDELEDKMLFGMNQDT